MKRNDGLAAKLCDVCEEEQRSEAQVYCAECGKYYCTGCDAFFHQRGKYKLHSRESIGAPTKEPLLDDNDDDDSTLSEQHQDSKKTLHIHLHHHLPYFLISPQIFHILHFTFHISHFIFHISHFIFLSIFSHSFQKAKQRPKVPPSARSRRCRRSSRPRSGRGKRGSRPCAPS